MSAAMIWIGQWSSCSKRWGSSWLPATRSLAFVSRPLDHSGGRETKAISRRGESRKIPPMPPLVEVRDVVKCYGRIEALAGVSFDIESGELFGLLGPNGAGKTTLIAIAAGLSLATSGSVRLLGEPLAPAVRAARRSEE